MERKDSELSRRGKRDSWPICALGEHRIGAPPLVLFCDTDFQAVIPPRVTSETNRDLGRVANDFKWLIWQIS